MIFSREVRVRPLFEKETSTYTYLVYDESSKKALIIDPVKETLDRDIKLIGELNLDLTWVLETHLHADHITSAHQLASTFDAKIAISSSAKVENERIEFLEDAQTISVSENLVFKTIHTPGHTNCSVCFLINNLLFTGDTLFIRGCGRTDFQQGSNEDLYNNVREKLFSLDDETLVLPGHDYKGEMVSTIGEEKLYNPRLKLDNSLDDFSNIMNGLNLSYPKKIDVALPANRTCGRV
jgi:glyoxylase-like metal-dependent hydrolase (beta-lactamase superfamily II)